VVTSVLQSAKGAMATVTYFVTLAVSAGSPLRWKGLSFLSAARTPTRELGFSSVGMITGSCSLVAWRRVPATAVFGFCAALLGGVAAVFVAGCKDFAGITSESGALVDEEISGLAAGGGGGGMLSDTLFIGMAAGDLLVFDGTPRRPIAATTAAATRTVRLTEWSLAIGTGT